MLPANHALLIRFDDPHIAGSVLDDVVLSVRQAEGAERRNWHTKTHGPNSEVIEYKLYNTL